MKKIKGTLVGMLCGALFFSQMSVTSLAAAEQPGYREAKRELREAVEEMPVLALVYLCDEYGIRTEADFDSAAAVTVPSGTTVEIRDIAVDREGEVWVYVKAGYGEDEVYGYIQRSFLATSDERFLAWEGAQGIYDAESITFGAGYADVAAFPESYRPALEELKRNHPSWIFVRMDVGLDWNTVINNELLDGRSLVHKSFPDYTKAGAYDDGDWFYATKDILKYYMDPRNGLTEQRIFQFELLTYNASYHTEAAVDTFLNNTFMNSENLAPGTEDTYAHIFWKVGSDTDILVSPFHLASRVYQEQGRGTSELISGNYPGYEGYYNYFNVRASGTTHKEVVERGLAYARDNGWNNAYNSIRGGANVISANYIRKGQDTLYLQKYNVNPDGYYPLYTHQYMQNISAPTTEATTVRKQYAGVGSLENTFVFKIPVYNNMPGAASPYPTGDSGKNGLCQGVDGGWHYYVNGTIATDYTGLAQNEAGWWYVKNGSLDWNYTGLASNEHGWWYVKNGAIDFGYTGAASNEYGWGYVKNGAIDLNYTGLALCNGAWRYIIGGRLDTTHTGLVQNESGWWYVKNGLLDWNYTGLASNEHGLWYVRNGALDFGYTGEASDGSDSWYVRNGQVDRGCTGLMPMGSEWKYVNGGKIDRAYTGLAQNEAGWWYVKNGVLDWNYTGMASNEHGWWYVTNGALDMGYTGEGVNEFGRWYLINGQIAYGYTGLLLYNDMWQYVKEGKFQDGHTGLVENENGWWYVSDGSVDWSYTGLAQNEFGWWYVSNGGLDLSYTGEAYLGDERWYVKDGQIDYGYTGLLLYNDLWQYVNGGKFDDTYTGLAANEQGLWYVSNGVIDWNFTGVVQYEGQDYYVQNGAAIL